MLDLTNKSTHKGNNMKFNSKFNLKNKLKGANIRTSTIPTSLKYQSPLTNQNEDSDFIEVPTLGFSCSSAVMNTYTVHLNQPVLTPSYYNNIMDLMLNATENDCIVFLVSSPGGRADGLLYLIEGLRMTDANTVAVLIGEVASSASIFSLHCNDVEVTEFSSMLCHNASFGSGGKVQDVISHVQHVAKNTEKLMRATYEGFLSELEIQEMLAGKEIYLDSEQINERMVQREEYYKNKLELESLEALDTAKGTEEESTDNGIGVYPPIEYDVEEVQQNTLVKRRTKKA
jgi:ATP-dependent protease ClpP protease subunit